MSQTELANGICSREYIDQIEKGHLLLDLITEYENSGVPIEGELLQYICYAKSLYYGNINHQFEKAIEYCLNGIHYHYPDFTPTDSYLSYHLSNIELALLQCLFNHYYRIGDRSLSLIGHQNLFAYLTQKLNTSITLLKKYGYTENLPELLFDRTHIYSKLDETDAYEDSLSEAIFISNFFLGPDKTENLRQWLEQNK